MTSNLQLRSILALALMIAGRDADAVSECRRILELDENYYLGHFYLSFAYVQLGKRRSACFRRKGLFAGALGTSRAPDTLPGCSSSLATRAARRQCWRHWETARHPELRSVSFTTIYLLGNRTGCRLGREGN